MPSRLGAAAAVTAEVRASFQPGRRGGHALLVDAGGGLTELRCRKVRPLCDHLDGAAARRVSVSLARVGALGDTWMMSALLDGREIIDAAEVESRYALSRAVHLLLAAAFLAAAAAFAWFARR